MTCFYTVQLKGVRHQVQRGQGLRFVLPRGFALVFLVLGLALGVPGAQSAPNFDTSNPICFFTNVANALLSAQLKINLTQIEVYPTNQYTPAINRLLQVTANIFDATTTNFYPTVFRPVFSTDATGTNVFISGYQQVASVNGIGDPQLATPYEVSYLGTLGPITNLAVNIYGLPWILGAKKNLPGFYQFSMLNQVEVTRELEFTRLYVGGAIQTNQSYIFSVSNNIGCTFWNSYSNTYPDPVQIHVHGFLQMTWSNSPSAIFSSPLYDYDYLTNTPNWPGSGWNTLLSPQTRTSSAASFVSCNWSYPFILPQPFYPSMGIFPGYGNINVFDPGPVVPLPQIELLTTNWFSAVILDGNHVIDYVQLAGPNDAGNITNALADPFSGTIPPPATIPMWSLNKNPNGAISGIYNQIAVSLGVAPIPNESFWLPEGFPTEDIADQQLIFGEFFSGNPDNSDLEMIAPYTPTRTLILPYLLQANDPLVHYQVSDLNGFPGSIATWQSLDSYTNGIWFHTDDGLTVLPSPPINNPLWRYQPWGTIRQMAGIAQVDTNALNSAFKDPLVWGSDYWNFPTNQSWNLNWLGQVHRGTPWQTIYLKTPNVLSEVNSSNFPIGTNTWSVWTGVADPQQAALISPLNDWQLVETLAALLNTNDLSRQFSINNPDPNAWASLLDGMTVLTNTTPNYSSQLSSLYLLEPLQFNPIIISSNSPQAAFIAQSIESARASQPNQAFHHLGDVLSLPQLSTQSPYLNWSYVYQPEYGISDAAYEALPSQLLPLLRTDSIGAAAVTNSSTQIQFTGYNGHTYVLQASADLVHWSSVNTNSPVQGVIQFNLAPTPASAQFYRTLLLQ